jgi:hypothetical protein
VYKLSQKEETGIQNEIMVALCRAGCVVFRRNVGLFYTQDGRMIRIGEKGEADLQGHRADGKCFYIETKTLTGAKRKEQEQFVKAMKQSGAIAGFARTPEQAIEIIEKG